MTKVELSERWAELGGWSHIHIGCYGPEGRDELVGRHPKADERQAFALIPDFTEPNRFFTEVVPKMRGLGVEYIFNDVKGLWRAECFDVNQNDNLIGTHKHKDIGEAGLEAAIKARGEL